MKLKVKEAVGKLAHISIYSAQKDRVDMTSVCVNSLSSQYCLMVMKMVMVMVVGNNWLRDFLLISIYIDMFLHCTVSKKIAANIICMYL